jgi:hypothetical protein
MKLDEATKEQIDALSYEDLLVYWRFAPPGTAWCQGKAGYYFCKVLDKKRRALGAVEAHRISKKVSVT